MSKYSKLWEYVSVCGKSELLLSFDDAWRIAGVEIDHSLLKFKSELRRYGYRVEKISIKNKTIKFEKMSDTAVLYIHGRGGNPSEYKHYIPLFPNCDVIGVDYRAETAKDARTELMKLFDTLTEGYKNVILVANSIGAYFAMLALKSRKIQKAYFISPIVDMEKLIENMMCTADVSEEELERRGIIETDFGEVLSWEYLSYVRKNPIEWSVPTSILYGSRDNMTSLEQISEFSKAHNAELTVMNNGEHWFHTPEQMHFLDCWIKSDTDYILVE